MANCVRLQKGQQAAWNRRHGCMKEGPAPAQHGCGPLETREDHDLRGPTLHHALVCVRRRTNWNLRHKGWSGVTQYKYRRTSYYKVKRIILREYCYIYKQTSLSISAKRDVDRYGSQGPNRAAAHSSSALGRPRSATRGHP